MVNKVFNIKLDLRQNEVIQELARVTQSDNETNVFKIRLYDGLTEINYNVVSKAIIVFSKSDGQTVQGTMKLDIRGYTYTLGTNEIAAPGLVLTAVLLYGPTGERLTTCRFKVWVDKDMLPEDAVASTTQLDALSQLLQQLEDKISLLDGLMSEADLVILNDKIDAQAEKSETHINRTDNPHGANAAQTGASNPNILHNWDFRNPVNQRGQTEFIGSSIYTIDMWRFANTHMSLNVIDGGISVTSLKTSPAYLTQRLESDLTGDILTFTVQTIDGDYYSCSGLCTKTNGTKARTSTSFGSIIIEYLAYRYSATLEVNGETSIGLKRAKLELGSISTLANDPPMDYGLELTKCHRYFFSLSKFHPIVGYSGYRNDFAEFPIYQTMRIKPSLILLAGSEIPELAGSGSNRIPTSNIIIGYSDSDEWPIIIAYADVAQNTLYSLRLNNIYALDANL